MSPNPKFLNAGGDATWQNLGDWSTAQTYGDAAEALAARLGRMADLATDDHVLDIGAGCGDQLALWRGRFGVARITAIEPDPGSAAAARRRTASLEGVEVHEGTDLAIGERAPTVILSLDAAYHFRSRRDFLRRAATALKPGGRLALADIFAPTRIDARARLLALFAGIPQRNLWTAAQWHAELAQAGFERVMWTDATDAVLGGFGASWRQWVAAFLRRPRWSAIGIIGTALAAANAARHGWLGYVIVAARRAPTSIPAATEKKS